jgi:hypothetical protein
MTLQKSLLHKAESAMCPGLHNASWKTLVRLHLVATGLHSAGTEAGSPNVRGEGAYQSTTPQTKFHRTEFSQTSRHRPRQFAAQPIEDIRHLRATSLVTLTARAERVA